MYSKNKFPIEIGKVTITLDKDIYIRLFWRVDGKRSCVSFGRNEGDNLKVAIATAQTIDSDLTFDRYDWTEAKYQPPWKKVSPISNNNVILQPQEMTLREIWERYKGLKEESTAKSTKDIAWRCIDRLIDAMPPELLSCSTSSLL
jgi:hypothetical protein